MASSFAFIFALLFVSVSAAPQAAPEGGPPIDAELLKAFLQNLPKKLPLGMSNSYDVFKWFFYSTLNILDKRSVTFAYIINMFDYNSNTRVELTEFTDKLKSFVGRALTPNQKKAAQLLFKRIKIKTAKFITQNDLSQWFKKQDGLGGLFSDWEVNRFKAQLPTARDLALPSEPDVVYMLEHVVWATVDFLETRGVANKIISIFDENQDKKVSFREFQGHLRLLLGFELTRLQSQAARTLFKQIAKQNKYRITEKNLNGWFHEVSAQKENGVGGSGVGGSGTGHASGASGFGAASARHLEGFY